MFKLMRRAVTICVAVFPAKSDLALSMAFTASFNEVHVTEQAHCFLLVYCQPSLLVNAMNSGELRSPTSSSLSL
jgi:hypothetical protein